MKKKGKRKSRYFPEISGFTPVCEAGNAGETAGACNYSGTGQGTRGYPMTNKLRNVQLELTDRKSFTALANDQPVNTILHTPRTQE